MRLSVGERLAGRFEIRSVIAERPTGILYHAFDEQIGVDVALRIISQELLSDEGDRHAFVHRAARAKSLQHPNLMRLYDVLVDDSSVFLVTQWAPGERLSQRLLRVDEGAALSVVDARSLVRSAASGMAHAHQHGVILGTVRPDTIIVYPDGMKLTNVGLGPALPRERFIAVMTKHGALDDLAPELRAGRDPDERADLYALARLAERLLESCALQGQLTISDGVRSILTDGSSENPTNRRRDAELFARELESALDGRSVVTSAPSVSTRNDTERVDKMTLALPIPVVDKPLATPPTAEIRLDPYQTTADQVTSPQGKRAAPPLELELDELVEIAPVPDSGQTQAIPRVDAKALLDITDVGHRSVIRLEDETPEPILVDSPRLVEPGSARRALTSALELEPLVPLDEDSATRQVPRIEHGNPIELSRTVAEPILELVPTEPARSPVVILGVALIIALTIGALGMLVIRTVNRPAQVAPVVVVTHGQVTTEPKTSPTPSPTPTPTAISTPVANPLPSPVPVGECALGMVALDRPYPYCIDLYEYPGGHTVPRTSVSLSDARQVCATRGLRLCTDVEWDQACRGPAQASFPYGQSYDPLRCNTAGKAPGVIRPTGSMPRCRSAAGVYDMSGNVAEWSASGAQRGGSAFVGPPHGRCSHAVRNGNLAGADDVGFRCCGGLQR